MLNEKLYLNIRQALVQFSSVVLNEVFIQSKITTL